MSCSCQILTLCALAMLTGAAAVAQIPPGYEVVQLTNDAAREWNASINNRGQIVYESWRDGLALLDVERYRLLYPACDPLLADSNGDGVVDAFDIEPFIQFVIP